MAWRRSLAGLHLVVALVYASSAAAVSPAARFDEATRFDLEGKPQLAFLAYLRAAEAGLPQAQFNVAVMLDSGRGVDADLTKAAVWYARAAAHGLPRACYNLGQLYEAGQGVPLNADLAAAWFEASKLPASYDHRARVRPKLSDIKLIAPDLVAPPAGSKIDADRDGIELVWTSRAQPEPAQFYVELNSVDKSGLHQIFSVITKVSSVFVKIPRQPGSYAWRVSTLATDSGQYVASNWSDFQM